MYHHHEKKLALTTIVLAILSLMVTGQHFFPVSEAANLVNDDCFSIMQITDTQFLSVSFPKLFNDTTSWIVNNSANYNLQMVVHTGDIVDNINSTSGAYSDPAQWNTANIAMSYLLNAGIPYCWDAGNHDQIPWNDATGTWLGSSYEAFNASSMHSKSYWVSDIADSKNTAVKFSYNGYEFLIINVEYKASNSTLNWMQSLLDNNKGVNIIVAAHTYLNVKGGYGFASAGLPGEVAWCTNFKAILDSYPNVFLTLSGHDPSGTANRTRVGNREEIFFNRQAATTPAGQTGCAAVRIYTFNLTSKNVTATTYSLDTQTWLTNSYNQFSFNATIRLPLSAASSQAFTNIPAGTIASFLVTTVTGGVAPYSYQWYQGSSPVGTNTYQLALYPSTPGTYTYYCRITDSEGTAASSPTMTLTVSSPPSQLVITPKPIPQITITPTPTPSAIHIETITPTPDVTTTPNQTDTQQQFTLEVALSIVIGVIVVAALLFTLLIRRQKNKK
jgi:hypothetical protein